MNQVRCVQENFLYSRFRRVINNPAHKLTAPCVSKDASPGGKQSYTGHKKKKKKGKINDNKQDGELLNNQDMSSYEQQETTLMLCDSFTCDPR